MPVGSEVCGIANSDPQQFNEGDKGEESTQHDKKSRLYDLFKKCTSQMLWNASYLCMLNAT